MTETPQECIAPPARSLEHRLAKPMVSLSFVYLALLAGIIPNETGGDLIHPGAFAVYFDALIVLAALFVLEFAMSAYFHRSRWTVKHAAHAFAVALIPPLRVGLKPFSTPDLIWLPVVGWRRQTKPLARNIARAFNAPMMTFALMIVPVLAIEYLWSDAATRNPWLLTVSDIATRVIWFAFAVEFVVMVSVSERKIAYCKNHWIDLAIILLPLISFLRMLRLMRLGRLASLQNMTRAYRLRGLSARLLRIFVVFDVGERFGERFTRRRLAALRGQLKLKEEELDELREQIVALESDLVRQCGDNSASAASPTEPSPTAD